jgi:PAS domain S-box-containing protein
MPDSDAEILMTRAIDAVRGRAGELGAALDELPAPIYVTDPDGRITAFNRACIAFAGRTPKLGEDRWCVTWRLYTEDGEALAHEDCPMAVAIRERRPVRGLVAIAERPDGTRRHFMPFPTPIFDEDGTFAGAANLFVDLGDRNRVDYLHAQAERCRRLAATIGDDRTVETLLRMASEYEARAAELERPH